MSHKKGSLKYFGATDVGQVRDHNEDSFVIIDLSQEENNARGTVFMVADGMGGANAGEVASAIACNVVEDRFLKLQTIPDTQRNIEKYLKNLLLEAHQQILQHASQHPECTGMGTTAVIAWVIDDQLHVTWCGDSRCYVYQKKQQYTLKPLTDDHSLVWQMVLSGELSAEEARIHEQSNIILQVLGSTDSKPKPSYLNKRLVEGEKILLCSDGLNGMLSDAAIQQILEGNDKIKDTTGVLIDEANRAGGSDNITVIYVEVEATLNTATRQKRGVLSTLKSKWPFVLALSLLLLVLVYSLIAWKGSKASPEPKTEDRIQPTISESHSAQSSLTKESDEMEGDAKATNAEADKPGVTTGEEHLSATKYNFLGALDELNIQLEEQINNTKKLIEGCQTCNDNPQLENVNESLSATHDLIKSQIKLTNQNLPISSQSKEKLSSISQSVNVSYDADKKFNTNSIVSEQEYMVNTITKVVKKINKQLETLTIQVQEQN
ncbi:serine/threonine protein phosphatase PrpC [Catalinimonas alkaloidigena]|uniref:Stp1/IreP family PP2C-type Ser/Thr phosphatase n=1 Tax=Catalinimonas alkaloidigena TaxID=1075417 RepID=UPI002405CF72|nr:Stp1/IreP family PP2C-type Ser/Thr phosphatase [Catalinimonas alkaloidigena]MDF9798776.1 serine/threonine protein phosphatase PrpC [Catalinimonas alkaloidigena]